MERVHGHRLQSHGISFSRAVECEMPVRCGDVGMSLSGGCGEGGLGCFHMTV